MIKWQGVKIISFIINSVKIFDSAIRRKELSEVKRGYKRLNL